MSFSTTGPSGRQVNGTAFTVSWDFWGLQDGPHWVTGTFERHTCPGRLDEVPQDGALASGNLVSLGNLGWLNSHLGAYLGFLLKLRQDGWGHHGRGTSWDHPGGNLQLRPRVDTVSSDSLRHNWLQEVAADTAQLVLELNRWDNLNDLSVGLDLFQKEPWSLNNHNMVWGHEDLSNDSVISNVLDNDNLADWDLNWLAIDQDRWEGRGWDNLDQILL